jgi:transcription elongation factor GreA
MTPRGKAILEERLAGIEEKRPALLKAIREAREKGDLTENAEYHAAKESLAILENKIADLEDKLVRSQIVDPRRAPRDKVAFGATVKVLDLDTDEEETYHLVGAGEDDVKANRILTTSPVAQGLLLRKVGDEVEIEVPRGRLRYRVLEIGYPE